MQDKNHYPERVMSGDDAVSEYYKLKAKLNLTPEEHNLFKRPKEKIKVRKKSIPAGYKQCSTCGEIKPLQEFYTNGKKLDGSPAYHGMCMPCYKAYRKFYYKKRWDFTKRTK